MGCETNGIYTVLSEVKNWSKVDWLKQLGEIANECPVGGEARLFWTISHPQVSDLREHLQQLLPRLEVECTETHKVKQYLIYQGRFVVIEA